jgi:hypothetical protein
MKDAKTSNSTSLSIYIRELDKQEKEYQGFRIKIKDTDNYLTIPQKNDNSYETNKIILTPLTPLIRYNIEAQYKYNNEWIDVLSCTFVTQENVYEKYPFIPIINYMSSGAIPNITKNPNPVIFTIKQTE